MCATQRSALNFYPTQAPRFRQRPRHLDSGNINNNKDHRFSLSLLRPAPVQPSDHTVPLWRLPPDLIHATKATRMDMIECEKPTTTGELKLSDLPPIEDLTITAPTDDLVKIGQVHSIVGVLVVVAAERSMPPLDLDTILFKKDGSPVGQIFDVFGSVMEPHYSIRFTNQEQIKDKGIEIGQDVWFLPQPGRNITRFAFVHELQKQKGTDRSWENDNEPPSNIRDDSSDDDS